jgi:hypothetical protein
VAFPLGSFVPDITGNDIELAVAVDVGYRHTFRPKLAVEHELLPADRLWLGLALRRR